MAKRPRRPRPGEPRLRVAPKEKINKAIDIAHEIATDIRENFDFANPPNENNDIITVEVKRELPDGNTQHFAADYRIDRANGQFTLLDAYDEKVAGEEWPRSIFIQEAFDTSIIPPDKTEVAALRTVHGPIIDTATPGPQQIGPAQLDTVQPIHEYETPTTSTENKNRHLAPLPGFNPTDLPEPRKELFHKKTTPPPLIPAAKIESTNTQKEFAIAPAAFPVLPKDEPALTVHEPPVTIPEIPIQTPSDSQTEKLEPTVTIDAAPQPDPQLMERIHVKQKTELAQMHKEIEALSGLGNYFKREKLRDAAKALEAVIQRREGQFPQLKAAENSPQAIVEKTPVPPTPQVVQPKIDRSPITEKILSVHRKQRDELAQMHKDLSNIKIWQIFKRSNLKRKFKRLENVLKRREAQYPELEEQQPITSNRQQVSIEASVTHQAQLDRAASMEAHNDPRQKSLQGTIDRRLIQFPELRTLEKTPMPLVGENNLRTAEGREKERQELSAQLQLDRLSQKETQEIRGKIMQLHRADAVVELNPNTEMLTPPLTAANFHQLREANTQALSQRSTLKKGKPSWLSRSARKEWNKKWKANEVKITQIQKLLQEKHASKKAV